MAERGGYCKCSTAIAGAIRAIWAAALQLWARWRRLPRRQNHHHLPAFEAGLLLDLGDLRSIALDPIEQFIAEFLVRHFAAAEPQRHLDLVAFLEEALD